jgi:glycosyltransferase involved in cell wall biosynthesis
MIKVALVSTIQPETHYTRYLTTNLQKLYPKKLQLLLYVDDDKLNTKSIGGITNIHIVWKKGIFYPFLIIKQVVADHIRIVHLQQEMNMYGKPLTAIIFPFLVLVLFLFRKKVIITFHAAPKLTEIDYQFLRTFSYPENKLTLLAAKTAFRYLYMASSLFSSKIIVHTNYIKKTLIADYKLNGKKIVVVPIGVEKPHTVIAPDVFDETHLKIKKPQKIILFFGFLLKRKGLEYLIDAYAKLEKKFPNFLLILAGGTLDYQNTYINELKQRVKKYRLNKKIIFTAFLNEKQIHYLYQNCYCLVLPYTYSISSSLPLSFAIMYHKPVIATSIGSLKEEIADKQEGLLCKPTDTNDLQKKIELLITDNRLYHTLEQGMKRKFQLRTWENVAKDTFKIYESLK